ncbi:MAG: hypothetical protein J5659_01650 [Clostridia bacterium]|nr:hypothetical protein [Clostridia bacterium]
MSSRKLLNCLLLVSTIIIFVVCMFNHIPNESFLRREYLTDCLIGVFSGLIVALLTSVISLNIEKRRFVHKNAILVYSLIQSIERFNDMVNIGSNEQVENKELRINLIDDVLKCSFAQATFFESNNVFSRISALWGRHKQLLEINCYLQEIEKTFKDFRSQYINYCNDNIDNIETESNRFTDALDDFRKSKETYIEKIKTTLYSR